MKKRKCLRLFLCAILIMCTVCMGVTGKKASAEEKYTIISGSRYSSSPVALTANNVLYAVEFQEDEAMYFTLKTGAQSGFYYLYVKDASTNRDMYIYLTDALGQNIASSYSYLSPTNVKLQTNTTYNLELCPSYGTATGYALIKIGFVPDYVGDTKEAAKKISLGQKVTSSIDGDDDVDFYKVTTGAAGDYIFNIKCQNSDAGYTRRCEYTILNAINDELCSGVVYSSSAEESTISLLGNTTYYIKIERGYYSTQCNYSFTFSSKDKQKTQTPVSKPAKVKNLRLAYYGSSSNQCEYTWTSVAGADGYQVEVRTVKGNKKLFKKATTSNYIYCNIYGKGRIIKTRVRAYKNNNGTKVYGKWSSYICAAATKGGTVTRSSDGKKITLKWKKVTGVKWYRLYISTQNGKGYKKVATISGNKTKYVFKKYAGKKLKKGKTYYIKMEYVTKIGSKKKTSSVYTTATSKGLR